MTACSHCGREAAPNNLYCQYCGQKLDAQPVASPVGPVGQANQHAEVAPVAESRAELNGNGNGNGYFAAGPWMPAASGEAYGEMPAASMPGQHAQVATAVALGRLIVRSTSSGEGQIGTDEREYILDEHDVAIGRSPSCDIALSGDQLASRRHALLRYRNGHFTVVDLGSSNGTYVNDREIREETTLQDGDFVKIGGHELLFSTGQPGPHASLAGMRLSAPLPAMPLAETNPSVPAIDLFAPAQPAPAAEADEAPAVETAEDVVAASATETGEAPDDVGAGFPPERSLLEEKAGLLPAAPAAMTGNEAASGEASSDEPGAVNFILSDGADASASGSDDALDVLRVQLANVTSALTERAAQDAANATRLRTALREVRVQLASALALSKPAPDDVDTGDLSELVMVARQAAQNPRHLDYVTTLAARAGEMADALEARPASEPDATLRATIEGLLARLDELLA